MTRFPAIAIDRVDIAVYRIPTDSPESDGTLEWDHTDVVVARIHAGAGVGLGWTYASKAAAVLATDILAAVAAGRSAFSIEAIWREMNHRLRNAGRPGAGMMAIAAIDTALWDLKGRILGVSLLDLFGAARDAVPIYGSGGFTSYSEKRLTEQLSGWVSQGIPRVKMKVGRDADADLARVRAVRRAIGDAAELFVDANGAYSRKQALALAEQFAGESNVSWFEEPRSSDDLRSLRFLRNRAPAPMDIAAGEYGDTIDYFQRMLAAGAVDCLQADATRCGGYTGFFQAAALCDAFHVPLSAHCAPQLHAHVGCAAHALRHVEYFHDHVRIDHLLFDGVLEPRGGKLQPDRSRPGHGMTLKAADAERYRV
jgi:L-alanine-DL-glutamate epimerase-like enolase superfamily enzyme